MKFVHVKGLFFDYGCDKQAISNWNRDFFGLTTYLTKSLESLGFVHMHTCKFKFYRSIVTTDSSFKK